MTLRNPLRTPSIHFTALCLFAFGMSLLIRSLPRLPEPSPIPKGTSESHIDSSESHIESSEQTGRIYCEAAGVYKKNTTYGGVTLLCKHGDNESYIEVTNHLPQGAVYHQALIDDGKMIRGRRIHTHRNNKP